MGDLDHGLERRQAVRIGDPVHELRPVADGIVDLPGLGVAAAGEDCSAGGQTLVVAGMPTMSLLIEKLRETDPSCGQRMPSGGPYLGEEVIAAIETWIMMGAMR